ncbi:hypothetical protein CVIRNUC_003490 [Coccomyxa viridis]|uniref:Thioredoxin domain-containing protein n=1 Tax=Coccomyxa viridis TaxID=1274662 RepID=A0AAV1I1T7_9CHLO|nr:hypothetical protein CVIRNUC_003490 [Coccomyxa viridis]
MLSPFPMSMLFDRCAVSDGDTVIGLRLNYKHSDADPSDLPGYLMALTRTMLAHVKNLDDRILSKRPRMHVIDLYTEPAESLFDLDKSVKQRQTLVQSAYDETMDYFGTQQTVRRVVSDIMHQHVVEKFDDQTTDVDRPTLTLYYVEWCPYSVQMMPEWNKLTQRLLGSQIIVRKVDADASPGLAQSEGVRAFPTILLTKNGVTTTFEGERTADMMMRFVQLS